MAREVWFYEDADENCRKLYGERALTECSIDETVLGVSGETDVERSFVTCIVHV